MSPPENPLPPPAAGGEGESFRLSRALREMIQLGASDLHLKAGRPPVVRVGGELKETELPVLRPNDLAKVAEELMSPEHRERFRAGREMDFAIGVPGVGRFRTTVFQQRGTLGFAFRAIPFEIPTLEELNLPPVMAEMVDAPRGLILVTGVTGSGKSTTLASLIRSLNDRRALNVVTVEDPIEFLHRDSKSFISQREVGTDTSSFHDALRHVLRQDPDVIMLGEIRDRESMETVLKAADTGHLVLSTLHTTDAAQTIGRVVSFFPPHQHAEVRDLLAAALRAIVSLRLIPRADNPGRVPAAEVLVNTAAISERIRDAGQLHTVHELLAEGKEQYGMQTFDQSLLDLHQRGLISYDWALRYASNPSEFALRVSGVESGAEAGWDPEAAGREQG
ncbi:MAG: type IV pilus twitching motility protein PilT [Longimicrobiaceae bacterium]